MLACADGLSRVRVGTLAGFASRSFVPPNELKPRRTELSTFLNNLLS